jgi:SAM-dependent methyltransferase
MSQDRIEAAQAAGQERTIRSGISGVTSISILRRVHDARFATRYFRGDGIDVGGGIDSIALYQELFPGIRNCFVYDQQHGDAQLLANVRDASFDFLYSSHCLEHLRDPVEALRNWLRVVKPGGHLVVEVPDEDLYEQGHWPSRFAGEAQVLSAQLLDQGFRYGLAGRNFDQTRTPSAECGIEFVLRKLAR